MAKSCKLMKGKGKGEGNGGSKEGDRELCRGARSGWR